MNAAILLLAGNSERLQLDTKKQFIEIEKKPLFLYTFEAFYNLSDFQKIILVINPLDEKIVKKYLVDYLEDERVSIVYGGDSRQKSVLNALLFLENSFDTLDNVLIHDAARVLVSRELIYKVLDALETSNAVIPVCEVSDSLIQNENDKVLKYVSRDEYKLVQTPQGFKFGEILIAHQALKENAYKDDASLIMDLNKPVKIVHGDKLNLKVTTKEDLNIVRYILGARK